MIQNYRKEIVSPFQVKNRPYDIQTNRTVQEKIRENTKTLSLTAEFSEDTQTLQAFKHINGVIAFLCVLKLDGKTIGFGRSMSVVTKTNRWLDRVVNFVKNSALIDAVIKGTKIIDVLSVDFSGHQGTSEVSDNFYKPERTNSYEPATDKQKNYLQKLLSDSGDDYEPDEISGLSKSEAASRISTLVSAGESKINY